MVAIVTLCIAIPTVYQALVLEDKFQEIKDTTQTYRYIVLAENSHLESERIRYYTSALERSPDDVELYYLRANAYFNNGDYDSAKKDCNKAIHYDEYYNEAYYLRGKIYFEESKYDKALDDFLKYEPYDEIEYNVYLAYTYYFEKNYDKALEFLRDIEYIDTLDLIPQKIEYNIYYLRSVCYMELGEYDASANAIYQLYHDSDTRKDMIFIAEHVKTLLNRSGHKEKAELLGQQIISTKNEADAIRDEIIFRDKDEIAGEYEVLYNNLGHQIRRFGKE